MFELKIPKAILSFNNPIFLLPTIISSFLNKQLNLSGFTWNSNIFFALKMTVRNLQKYTDLEFPKILYYTGKMFWNKEGIIFKDNYIFQWILNPFWKYYFPMLFKIRIKFPLYTFIIPTSFRGFTPFVLWKEN